MLSKMQQPTDFKYQTSRISKMKKKSSELDLGEKEGVPF